MDSSLKKSNIVAFIPIRSGSKSIKDKNIKMFFGKPLIYWVLYASQNSRKINKVVVALDSEIYEKLISRFRFPKVEIYNRLHENATDMASTESVMLEYIDYAKLHPDDTFILVQATSPFTSNHDFDNAITEYFKSGKDSMLSCVKTKRFFWDNNGTPLNYDYQNRPRRQNFEGLFLENGAFYINSVGNILKYKNRLSGQIGIFEMPECTSLEIDEPLDWQTGEMIMNRRIKEIKKEIPKIKLFLTDVDGVLTDGGMYYSETGDELKKFNTRDGVAFELLRKKGIKTGFITGEDTKIVARRAEKLKIDYLFQGVKDKLAVTQILAKQLAISLDEIAYIGDDINDIELLKAVGISAAPSSAPQYIKDIVHFVTEKRGGEGAFREFVEWLLEI